MFRGPPGGFFLELPSYKCPRLRTVVQRMYLAGRSFVVRAGTVILLVNLLIWALGYFPHQDRARQNVERQRRAAGGDEQTSAAQLAAAQLRDSYLGQAGRAIEPVIRPLGWDWRIGVGALASFPAREVIIATLGTIANLGRDADARSPSLRAAIGAMTRDDTGQPLFTLPVALSVMVFFALCAQCSSTLVVIGRETGSWHWPLASFVGMTIIAYLAAWATASAAHALGL
jgi:ferrous iron transport protein B